MKNPSPQIRILVWNWSVPTKQNLVGELSVTAEFENWRDKQHLPEIFFYIFSIEIFNSNRKKQTVYFSNFQGLRNKASVASMTSTSSFHQKILILMIGSSLAPKWSKSVPFCGIDHQKSNFLLIISDTLFWKLVDATQISKPLEATRHHNSTKLLILLPLRAI